MNTLRDAYKNLIRGKIEASQAKAGAFEDLAAEEYTRRNPGSGMEQGRAAYRKRLGTPENPIKAPDANSAAIKFGKRGGGMFVG